jgi:uncharacterized cofD-like protein
METLRIVAIGGGTGLSTLLHGLKEYAPAQAEITAVVTVTDDGGSSGRLRREFPMLPPGDIRNCLVALAEDEAVLSKLFQYRFSDGEGLKGHSFGNLFLTALTSVMGDFPLAVKVSSEILATRGRIFPSTAQDVTLQAILADGAVVNGESNISKSTQRICQIRLQPEHCEPMPETLEAIDRADLITLGPGSLFTSVIPNLLVGGIANAIRNSRALKAYFVNLMGQPGETIDFRASDHVEAIHRHAYCPLLDTAVLNTGVISQALLAKYAADGARPVENDAARLRELNIEVKIANLLHEGETVRHDPRATAAVVMELAQEGHRRKAEEERE